MTGDDFREMALDHDGVVELSHMNHPDFRVNGRIYATLNGDESGGGVGLPPAEQKQLVEEHPTIFTPAAGAWGRQGWTLVHLAGAKPSVVRGALLLAWQHAFDRQAKPRRRRPRP